MVINTYFNTNSDCVHAIVENRTIPVSDVVSFIQS